MVFWVLRSAVYKDAFFHLLIFRNSANDGKRLSGLASGQTLPIR